MKLFSLIRYDIYYGIKINVKKYLIAIIIFSFLNLESYIKIHNANVALPALGLGTYADYMFHINRGMAVYIPSPDSPFLFPAAWLLVKLFLAFITLHYTSDELGGYAKNILIKSGRRIAWWISKCIWNIISVLLYFILEWVVTLLFCSLMKADIQLNLTPFLMEYILKTSINTDVTSRMSIVILFLMPLLISAAINLFQMMLSLAFKPILGFGITITLYIASAYLNTGILPGIYSMGLRSSVYVKGGILYQAGILSALVLGFLSVILGALIFKRYNILEKDQF